MRRTPYLLIVAILAVAPVVGAQANEASAGPQAGASVVTPPRADSAPNMRGRWALVGSVSSAETRRDAAVDRVTDEMSVFVRGIAGRRLRRGMPIPRLVVISGDGASFRVRVGPYNLNFAPDGARHAMQDPFDNDVQASQRLDGRRLRQVVRSDGGTLTHVLELSEDGQSLRLSIRIASPRLPADVVYRVRFRRS